MNNAENMLLQYRTSGDGMENSLLNENKNISSLSGLIKKPNPNILSSMKPVEPKSKICTLVPKYVPNQQKRPKYLIHRPKDPKFVPYEPYKGAVEPILPKKPVNGSFLEQTRVIDKPPSKNNIEIHKLVRQMSEMRMEELNKAKIAAIDENDIISKKHWEKERAGYETDIKNLRETNAHLENQLKFQAQVNSELKTLLVAAVGEDLESRVQHLTEDKLALARALLNSANCLTTHQEQTEWLSGQCEVWRSKFLASSVMVEELARWKSALTLRVNELQDAMKQLMQERSKAYKQSLHTFNNLNAVVEKLANTNTDLTQKNLVELISVNHDLSRAIVEITNAVVKRDKSGIAQHTAAEKNALKLLQNPEIQPNKEDLLCNALMGAAANTLGNQRFTRSPFIGSFCPHCKGEMQNI